MRIRQINLKIIVVRGVTDSTANSLSSDFIKVIKK